MLIKFTHISKKNCTLDVREDQTFHELIPTIIKQLSLDCESLKFIFSGKQVDENAKVGSIGYVEGKQIIIAPVGKSKAAQPPAATPAPATPGAAPTTQQQPVAPAELKSSFTFTSKFNLPRIKLTPSKTNDTKQPKPTEIVEEKPQEQPQEDNLSDEDYIKQKIETLPNKEKFEENLSDLVAMSSCDRNTAIAALIHANNNIVYASNMVLDRKVPPLRPPRGQPASRQPAPNLYDLIAQEQNSIITSDLMPPLNELNDLSLMISIDNIEQMKLRADLTLKNNFVRMAERSPRELTIVIQECGIPQAIRDPSRAFAAMGYVTRDHTLLPARIMPVIGIAPIDVTSNQKDFDGLSPEESAAVQRISQATRLPLDMALTFFEAAGHDEQRAMELIRQNAE